MRNYTAKACTVIGNWWDLWADVFIPTRKKLGHRGNKVWREHWDSRPFQTVSQQPRVNRPPLPYTPSMIHIHKSTLSPRVPSNHGEEVLKLWDGQPNSLCFKVDSPRYFGTVTESRLTGRYSHSMLEAEPEPKEGMLQSSVSFHRFSSA